MKKVRKKILVPILIIFLFITQVVPTAASYSGASGSFTGWDNMSLQQKYQNTAECLERVLKKEGYMSDVEVLYPEGYYATTEHGPNGVSNRIMLRLDQVWTDDLDFGVDANQYMAVYVYGYKDFVVFHIITGNDDHGVGYYWKYDWAYNQLNYEYESMTPSGMSIGEFTYKRFNKILIRSDGSTVTENNTNNGNSNSGNTSNNGSASNNGNILDNSIPNTDDSSSANTTVPDAFSIEDTYSFGNYESIFYAEDELKNYDYVSDGDLIAMHAYIYKYARLNPSFADHCAQVFRKARYKGWFGCCYGIAATEVLNYYGYLDVPENFGNTYSMQDIIAPRYIDEMRSLLYLYHLTQYLPQFNLNETGLEGLVEAARSGPVLVGYTYPGGTGGHAVVASGVENRSDGTKVISIYDSEAPNKVLECVVSADYSTCKMQTSSGTLNLPSTTI